MGPIRLWLPLSLALCLTFPSAARAQCVDWTEHLRIVGAHQGIQDLADTAIEGDLAFCADMNFGLRVFDLSKPEAPARIANVPTALPAMGVAVEGEYAFVITGNSASSLATYDVSDPAHPALVSTFSLGAMQATDVQVRGGVAYVGYFQATLQTIDVSNPAAPASMGSLTLPGGHVNELALDGSFAYLACGTGGLRIADVSDPWAPVAVGWLGVAYIAEHVAVGDGMAYLASGGQLVLVDVTSPNLPFVTSSMVLFASRLAVRGTLLFACGDRALSSINAQDSSNPLIVGSLSADGTIGSVAIHGDEVVLGCSTVLDVIDASNPTSPPTLTSARLPGEPLDVAVKGNLAFVASAIAGLHVLEVHATIPPSLIATLDTPGSAEELALAADHAYLADGSSFRIVDISSPAVPTLAASLNFTANDVEVADDLAYVSSGSAGLRIVDVSVPTAPSLVSTLDTADYATALLHRSGIVYLYDRTTGLLVIDVADPHAPQVVATLPLPFYQADDLKLDGSRLYVAGSSVAGQDLAIVDVSMPAAPTVIDTVVLPEHAYKLALSPPFAYVAEGYGGLLLLDISEPSEVRVIGTAGAAHWAQSVVLDGERTVLADARVLSVSSAHCVAAAVEPPITSSAELRLAIRGPIGGVVRFELSHASGAQPSLSLFDVSGRVLRQLAVNQVDATHGEASWDGRSESGVDLPSGVYFAVGRAGAACAMARVVWVR